MITLETNRNGSYVLTALVSDKTTPFDWYETKAFYGYTKQEARKEFKAYLKQAGLTIKRDI